MSANIYYQPLPRNPKSLNIMSPSSFIETLEKVFGKFPLELDEGDLGKLDLICSLLDREDFKELREMVEKHGRIRVWAGY